MKFREHRGTLAESIKTVVDVDGRAGLLAHIRKLFSDFGPEFSDGQMHVAAYHGDDDRIGWKDVHIVTIDGYGVVGFTEGPTQPDIREHAALRSKLSEAVEIISIMADMEPHLGVEPGSDDDRYTLYTSEKRQAHDITGDDIRRARAFIKESGGNGDE